MVTHDAHLAAWADRVVFIRDGSITSQTNPQGPESIASSSVPS
jgi:putative ABC transport system ATP-binding protein